MEAWHFFLRGAWSFKRSIFICLNDFPNPLHLYDSLSGERDSLTWLSNSFLCQMAFKVRKHSNIIHLNRSGFNLNPFPLALPLSHWRERNICHGAPFQNISNNSRQRALAFLSLGERISIPSIFQKCCPLFNLVRYSIDHSTSIYSREPKKNSSGISLFFASLLCSGTSFD